MHNTQHNTAQHINKEKQDTKHDTSTQYKQYATHKTQYTTHYTRTHHTKTNTSQKTHHGQKNK